MIALGLLALGCDRDAETTKDGTPPAASAEATKSKAGDAKEAKAEPPLSGHVVVAVGTQLMTASTGNVGVHVPQLGTGPEAPRGVALAVIGERDGRVELETLGSEAGKHACAGTFSGLGDFRLRFYLPSRADLLPVSTKEHEHAFADGTKVRLAPGIPVPPGSTELVVRGTPVTVTIPADRLGPSYVPGQPFSETEGKQGKLYLVPKGPDARSALYGSRDDVLTYDGNRLAEDSLYRELGNVVHYGTTPKDAGAIAVVRNACLEAEVLVSKARVEAPPSYDALEERQRELTAGVGALGLVGVREAKWVVRPGAKITWSDGSPAGEVIAEHRFPVAPQPEGDRTCFSTPFVDGQEASTKLCFAPGDVEETVATVSGSGSTADAGDGFGTGGGTGFGGRGKGVALVSMAAAETTGGLDKSVIRRVVRAHIGEVRTCYDKGLAKDAKLGGRIAIAFTIDAAGKVPAASVGESTIADASVGECIVKAAKTWSFPEPTGGGEVKVTYPFTLEPG
jgi:TonB family protein